MKQHLRALRAAITPRLAVLGGAFTALLIFGLSGVINHV